MTHKVKNGQYPDVIKKGVTILGNVTILDVTIMSGDSYWSFIDKRFYIEVFVLMRLKFKARAIFR